MNFLKYMIQAFLGLSFVMSVTVACSPVNFSAVPPAECLDPSLDPSTGCISDPDNPGFFKFTTNYVAPYPMVDILIVTDNSKSMANEQDKLKDNFGLLFNTIDNIDWQLGITTMDISNYHRQAFEIENNRSYTRTNFNYLEDFQDGNLVPFGPEQKLSDSSHASENALRVLKRSTVNREAVFAEGIKIDNSDFYSSGDERGIFAAALAVKQNKNTLFRDDAHLAIMFVTDEDVRSVGDRSTQRDKSPVMDEDRPEFLEQMINTELGSSKSVSVYPIVVPSDDGGFCKRELERERDSLSANWEIREGVIYEDLLSVFDGQKNTVCNSDWGSMLSDVGDFIEQRAREVITLSCIPDLEEGREVIIEGLEQYGSTASELDGKNITITPALPAGAEINIFYSCKTVG
ncbi:MAG: hypothetical protein AB8E15_02630 [Bdellovibrionales bacterium]